MSMSSLHCVCTQALAAKVSAIVTQTPSDSAKVDLLAAGLANSVGGYRHPQAAPCEHLHGPSRCDMQMLSKSSVTTLPLLMQGWPMLWGATGTLRMPPRNPLRVSPSSPGAGPLVQITGGPHEDHPRHLWTTAYR